MEILSISKNTSYVMRIHHQAWKYLLNCGVPLISYILYDTHIIRIIMTAYSPLYFPESDD